jgi:hypothetical protein
MIPKNSQRYNQSIVFTATSVLVFLLVHRAWSGELQDDFSKTALPILRQSCFACHGPKPNHFDSLLDPGVRKKAVKTVMMAQREFPMSETFPFPESDDPQEDLKLLVKTLKKGLMPPREQKLYNFGIPLAEKDKKALQDWATRCQKALH